MSKIVFQVEEIDYPKGTPFHPHRKYPEYQGAIGEEENRTYEMVRQLFHMLGLDDSNYGTEKWNPLGDVITPGDTVLLKPNFVLHRNGCGDSIWAVITHPSVIRAVTDYAYKAAGDKGRVIIADSPQSDCDFEELVRITQLKDLVKYYREEYCFEIELYDLRQVRFEYRDGVLLEDSRIQLNGDPEGYIIFDMSHNSRHEGIGHPERIYGADYDRSEVLQHHSNGHHEYCIAKTVMKADVVISLPKMKTHRKNGVTLNYKNFIGINGNKNYLPHFRIGDPSDGGDEYEPLNQTDKTIKYTNRFLTDRLLAHPTKTKTCIYKCIFSLYAFAKKILVKKGIIRSLIRGGAWYGNDTLWRTVADLYKIIEFGDLDGNIRERPQRKLFCIIDGIIAGEGNGPLEPREKHCGTLIAGEDLLAADLVAIRLMDIDYNHIQPYHELLLDKKTASKMKNMEVFHNMNDDFNWNDQSGKYFVFEEADGWKGRIRIES